TAFAITTLYRSRGDQIELYGYAASVCPTVRTVTVLGSCTVLPSREVCTVRTVALKGLFVRYTVRLYVPESSDYPKRKFKRENNLNSLQNFWATYSEVP